jgi:ketosteroid isomerase-like protein
MGAADVELVSRVQELLDRDLKSAPDDDALAEALLEFVDPQAQVRFMDSEGGALGDRRAEQTGVEGLREGWRDWLEPWEHFRILFGELHDAGDGNVLSLGQLQGEMRGGVELTQPGAALMQVRDGKIAAADFYVDQDRARRDAGIA